MKGTVCAVAGTFMYFQKLDDRLMYHKSAGDKCQVQYSTLYDALYDALYDSNEFDGRRGGAVIAVDRRPLWCGTKLWPMYCV